MATDTDTNNTNNLGGDMPQERLDKIKAAWMKRYGTSEADWATFKQQEEPLQNDNVIVTKIGFDSYTEEANKMEFPFCPDWTEMGHRYHTKSSYMSNLADKAVFNGDLASAATYSKDAAFWARMSQDCFDQAAENRRKM